MWRIEHKCSDQDPISDFAVLKGHRGGLDITRVVCPKPECRQEFVILGHEMFSEANRGPVNLPPGFVVARTRRI